MSKVYEHRAGFPDKLLGRVEEDGRVIRSRMGPDDRIGRVDLDSGKIYASRVGPDKYRGRVDLPALPLEQLTAFAGSCWYGPRGRRGKAALRRKCPQGSVAPVR